MRHRRRHGASQLAHTTLKEQKPVGGLQEELPRALLAPTQLALFCIATETAEDHQAGPSAFGLRLQPCFQLRQQLLYW